MAFDAAYAVSQLSPSTIQLIDQSTGADATIQYRQIFIYTYQSSVTIVPSGNPTGQAWILWPIADTEITLTDILSTDVCVNIYVVWYTPTPDNSNTYTINHAYCFKDYNEEFMEAIWAEKAVAQPNIVNSINFITNMANLRLNVDGAFQIIANASDVTKAQQLINEANQIRDRQSFYF